MGNCVCDCSPPRRYTSLSDILTFIIPDRSNRLKRPTGSPIRVISTRFSVILQVKSNRFGNFI